MRFLRSAFFFFVFCFFAACGVRSPLTDDFGDGGTGGCGSGATLCGGTCTVTQFDPNNCGACGTKCPSGESCALGACTSSVCNGGTTQCGAKCADTQNDPANCGTCGNACPVGQVCSGGQCALDCNGGTTKCANLCVDTQSDPKNCGFCGNACPGSLVCTQGGCNTTCLGGTTQCGQACVDLKVDPSNCGTCGNACPGGQVCSGGQCALTCGAGLTKCGNFCVDTSDDQLNCGKCGFVCQGTDKCISGACTPCDSSTTDCDGDGWKVSDGDCCDKPGPCGAEPALVNPGAVEVVGNGVDDNCNGLVDLFDNVDTQPCDSALASNSGNAGDYAKALGICRTTTQSPPLPQKTWGLLSAELVRADGTPLTDQSGHSIRTKFGDNILPLNGQSMVVLSNGTASDATQLLPGPNGGAPNGPNVSYAFAPSSAVDIANCANGLCIKDWLAAANPPLKAAGQLPAAPNCGDITDPTTANDSVMLVLTIRAPTNARAFSFNSYFFSAEFPEYVCTPYNDQFIALVDTPNGTPSPIANPVDKNLMTLTQNNQKWPIAINIASGTSVFSVCDAASKTNQCQGTSVSGISCGLGATQLSGTGFEKPVTDQCLIGGGTYWLTTAGNVIPGDIVQLRIAIWDVSDDIYDSTALIDGFQWLASATLPGTSN
ncbi:MAG TPA: MXAN_6577-like cysteine-rich protein [Polyangiaceae bacterium]|jgi:hypothetical protein